MRLPIVLAALAVAGLAAACSGSRDVPADADVCARATHLFSRCGVVLPTLSNTPCTGAARLVARCVVDHASDCDELATLTQRLDACVEDELDGGELLSPPADLPVPLGDDTADEPKDAGADSDHEDET